MGGSDFAADGRYSKAEGANKGLRTKRRIALSARIARGSGFGGIRFFSLLNQTSFYKNTRNGASRKNNQVQEVQSVLLELFDCFLVCSALFSCLYC
jgi:hypothetical protein